jgi:peptide/nickel transport system substrate-binding protein
MSFDFDESDQELAASGFDRGNFLRRAAAAGLVVALPGSKLSIPQAKAPKKGGKLLVGLVGGAETYDPATPVTTFDLARERQAFNCLSWQLDNGQLVPELAESFESNKKGDVWLVHLKKGVEWHNGKTLTSKDVVYTIQRIIKNNLSGASTLTHIDPNQIKAIDKYTVQFKLPQPFGLFPLPFAAPWTSITPAGRDHFTNTNLVGTGPFIVRSIYPGQQTIFARNPNYFGQAPLVDQLVFVNIGDDTARVNALIGGQVHLIESTPAAQVPTVSRSGMKVLNTPSSRLSPLAMNLNYAPFKDARVRQAFRLIPDRKAMVASALGGLGRVGNDLFDMDDPLYAKFTQRAQDIDKAKSLLKAAGQDGMTIELRTSQLRPGMLEGSLFFAQQAKQAGITVNINNAPVTNYFQVPQYYSRPFFATAWSARPMLTAMQLMLFRNSHWAETSWNNPQFEQLVTLGSQSLDAAKQKKLFSDAQQMLYNDGGYIVWGFYNILDGQSPKVTGVKRDRWGGPLGGYNFTGVSFV